MSDDLQQPSITQLDIAQSGIAQLAQNIVEKAQQNNIVIALAESCTGGMIAAALTDVPGHQGCWIAAL